MPGLLDRIFGGPSGGLLDPEQRRAAGARALQDFGLALMASDKPFAQAIAMGTVAGRQSYEQYAGEARRAGIAEELEQIFARGLQPGAVEAGLARALAGGDVETARTLGPILQSLIAAGRDHTVPPNLVPKEVGNKIIWFDPKTGMAVSSFELPPEGLTDQQHQKLMQAYAQFDTKTRNIWEVPLQVSRVMSATNRLLASYDPEGNSLVPAEDLKQIQFAAITALSSYARTIDPGSVVRSEEMIALRQQGTLEDKIKSWIMMATSGRMTYELALALQSEAKAQLLAQEPPYTFAENEAKERLVRAGIDKKYIHFANPYRWLIDQFYHPDGTPKKNYIGIYIPESTGGKNETRENPLRTLMREGG